jgi:hypothetical protein
MHTPCFGAKSELRPRKLSWEFIFTAAVIAACLSPTLAFGQTNSSWNGGTGNWSSATDWTPNGVPNNSGTATYDVSIGVANSNVTMDVLNTTIDNLTLASKTSLTITANAMSLVAGASFDDGMITNDGDVFNNGISSSLTISGVFLNQDSSGTSVPSTFNNAGKVFVTADGLIYNQLGSTINNSGTLNNAGSLFMQQGFINNFGTLTNTSGGTVTVLDAGIINSGKFNNYGMVHSEGNITNNSGGSLTNYGTINVVIAAMTNHGTLLNTAGGTINNDTGSQFFNYGTLTNAGTLSNSGSELHNYGTLNNSGTIINTLATEAPVGIIDNSGTFNNSGTVNNTNGQSLTNEGTLKNTGTLFNDSTSTITNSGTMNNALGASLANAGTLTNTGKLTNSGTVNNTGHSIESGTLTNSGTFNNNSGGTLIIDGSVVANTKGTIDAIGAGSAVLLENGVVVTGGTLSGVSGGVIETPSGQTATLKGVTNFGAYVMADNSTTTLSGKITNNGTISLASTGNQTIAMIVAGGATLAGSGTLTLGTGGPNIIEGSTGKEFLTNSSTIQGAGTITNVGLINNGTILANAGTLAIGPTVQGYAFTNNGSLIVDSGSAVNITGPVKLSFQTTGTVTVSSGATLSVVGSSAFTQTKGTTTVDGNLSAANGVYISGGTLDGNGGKLTGNLSLAGAALILGDGANKVGELTVSGGYSQTSTSFLNIDLGGTKSGTFDVLNITGTASLHGTLNVDALSGFTPTVGEQFDILNYSSETGTFSTVHCTFSNGDTCSIAYDSTGVVLTIDAPGTPAQSTVSASPAKRVSRGLVAGTPASLHEPTAILSRVTCFAGRLHETSCGSRSVASAAGGGELHATSVGAGSGTVHNNVMVATRSLSPARNGASHESSTSATAMARLYVCAYLPSTVAHTMGCN